MDLKNQLKSIGITIWLMIAFTIGVVSTPLYDLFAGIFYEKNVQILYAPGTKHKAVLLKTYSLMDMNFVVQLDGEKIFISPDLINLSDRQYRETMIWDKSGKVLVLEMMGKKVFAYHAEEKRKLNKTELNFYELSPILSDDNFYSSITEIK